MLEKRLKLGGLQVGGPRTSQNSARFRVANNVYQTRDDYYVPRFHGNEFNAPSNYPIAMLTAAARYDDAPFNIGLDGISGYHFFKGNGEEIPYFGTIAEYNWGPNYALPPYGPQFVEKLGCLYFSMYENKLFKYDGKQIYKAGVPLPYFSCAQYAAAGTTYVRVIQHHLDFQGNQVNSGYVQFRATPSAGNITIRSDKATTDIIGNAEVSPTSRPSWEELDGYYDQHYFVASGVTVAGVNEAIVTTGGNHNVKVGAYLIVQTQLTPPVITNLSENVLGYALKVKSFTATTVTLDLTNAMVLDMNRDWQQTALSPAAGFYIAITSGCNYFFSVWSSTSATGNYVFKSLFASMYDSTASWSNVVSVASPTVPAAGYTQLLINLSGNLGDMYDVTTVKGVFPSGNNNCLQNSSFSTYGDLALMSYKNEVFFSDTSLGGAFEMVNGNSFIVVGEGDDGVIQSVCGNSDFMFVSRQFKNYYVVGNLPTASYRVQEISQTSLGCYSNESSIAVNETILFFNKQGIWALYSGGRCEEVSQFIKGFFNNFSNTTDFDEDAYFDLSKLPTYAQDFDISQNVDSWIRLRLDVNRNLLAFCIAGYADGQGQILLLNLNNGEFTTWSGMLQSYPGSGDYAFKDLCFIDGDYYIPMNHGSTVALYKENKAIPRAPYDYMGAEYNPIMKTTWATVGEPSLEKKVNQLKIWGIIQGTISVSHAIDWSQSNSTSDGDLIVGSGDDQKFSHKWGIKPANALGTSIAMEFNGQRMEIEGLEIEFSPLQEGMKR